MAKQPNSGEDANIAEQLVTYGRQLAVVGRAHTNLVDGLPPQEELFATFLQLQEELLTASQDIPQALQFRQATRESLLSIAARLLFVAACADAQSQHSPPFRSYFDSAGIVIHRALYEKTMMGSIDAEKAARALYAVYADEVERIGSRTENRERDSAVIRAVVPDPINFIIYGQTTRHLGPLLDVLKRQAPETYRMYFQGPIWQSVDLVACVKDPAARYRQAGLAMLATTKEKKKRITERKDPRIAFIWVREEARRHGFGLQLLAALSEQALNRYRQPLSIICTTDELRELVAKARLLGIAVVQELPNS